MLMKKRVFGSVWCVLGLTALASTAYAQALPWEGRAYANVNLGMQVRGTDAVKSSQTFPIYDESGTITSTQNIDAGAPFFEVGGGIRIFGNFGIGVTYARLSTTGSSDVDASVPSPLFYDAPRSAKAKVDGLTHTEQAVHFHLVWLLPITDKVDLAVSGGPTAFKLTQGTVLAPTVSEVGAPYTSVMLTTTAAETTANRIGFNVGADLTYRFANNVGIGALVRYTGRTFALKPTGGAPLDVKVGGLQVGAGLRLRF